MTGTDRITATDQRILSILAGDNYRRKDFEEIVDVSNPSRNVDRLKNESLVEPVTERSATYRITTDGVIELRRCALPNEMVDRAEYRGGFAIKNWVNVTNLSPTHFHVMYAIDAFQDTTVQQIRKCVKELNIPLYVKINSNHGEAVNLTFYREICNQLAADGFLDVTDQDDSDVPVYTLTTMGEKIVHSDRLWAVSGWEGLVTALLTEDDSIDAAAKADDYVVSASLASDPGDSSHVDAQETGRTAGHTDAFTQ
ncbi:hypothetical protein [Halorubrum sp. Ea8]|uniref:hypothetical protein n=1 Tax=Halorubrum sp. Ea8 TaxID=1383841 RepID=UPI001140210C|nr:hypothetical protein [Halorubrum sp. Ea8]